MLFIPFQSTLKVHSLHFTSLPSSTDEDDVTLRPKTVKIYKNRAQILGFDEADDSIATQEIELSSRDWDPKTGTAKAELRFVNFQNVTSLVIFVVDGDGNGDETRLDRVRIIGETGEKRDPGKLEKIGEDE
jgi:PITH domain